MKKEAPEYEKKGKIKKINKKTDKVKKTTTTNHPQKTTFPEC